MSDKGIVMNIQELISVIEKLETRNNSYWNFYTVVIVAVCGWVISQKMEQLDHQTALILMIGNGFFYFMNLSIIHATTSRIVAFERELIHRATQSTEITLSLQQHLSKPFLLYRVGFTVGTHLIMDAAVLSFIYFSAW